jgi:hypothetical protein
MAKGVAVGMEYLAGMKFVHRVRLSVRFKPAFTVLQSHDDHCKISGLFLRTNEFTIHSKKIISLPLFDC